MSDITEHLKRIDDTRENMAEMSRQLKADRNRLNKYIGDVLKTKPLVADSVMTIANEFGDVDMYICTPKTGFTAEQVDDIIELVEAMRPRRVSWHAAVTIDAGRANNATLIIDNMAPTMINVFADDATTSDVFTMVRPDNENTPLDLREVLVWAKTTCGFDATA